MLLQSLTPKQLATLELVAEGRTSKEIALTQGVSPSAVVQRIEKIRNQCGGATRSDLARWYRDWRERQLLAQEHVDEDCNPFTGAPSEAERCNSSHLPPPDPVLQRASQGRTVSQFHLSDAALFEALPPWSGSGEPRVVPEVLDGEHSSQFRWLAAIALAIGMLVLFLVLLAVAEALGKLV